MSREKNSTNNNNKSPFFLFIFYFGVRVSTIFRCVQSVNLEHDTVKLTIITKQAMKIKYNNGLFGRSLKIDCIYILEISQ